MHDLIAGLVDRQGRRSLGFNVEQTVRVAGAVRDRLSTDNWRVLNRLLQLFTRDSRALDLDDALELIDDALVSLVAVGGLEMAHMTRDDGWRFLSLGRHLERLHFVSSTLGDVAPDQASAGSGLLEWLLELSDSLLTYRVRHMQQPEWESVVDLMLVDERNPRSAQVPAGEARQARPAAARCRSDRRAGGGGAAAATTAAPTSTPNRASCSAAASGGSTRC